MLLSKMSKRTLENLPTRKGAHQPKRGHWSEGLLETMNDPEYVVNVTDNAVVIKDKYPKAKFHYLILSKENLISIYNLQSQHIELLEDFHRIAEDIRQTHAGIKLLAGFHAAPSMQRLHMHLISQDMVSPCLKTKIHWNSFTTDFFIPHEDLLEELKENGCIKKISPEKRNELMSTPLKCNQCTFNAKNMPNLKEHLMSH